MSAFFVLLLALATVSYVEGGENVYGKPLAMCSKDPLTGWFRDGTCRTSYFDFGTHVVCARVTKEFLMYSKGKGNDLMTPSRRYRFPGLKPGDYWCLCALRWLEAYRGGKAPPINLDATHQKTRRYISMSTLEKFNVKNIDAKEEINQ